jgi:hypothetical protein
MATLLRCHRALDFASRDRRKGTLSGHLTGKPNHENTHRIMTFPHWITTFTGWFSSPTAHKIEANIVPATSALVTILKAFGLAGDHSTSIMTAVASAASSDTTNDEKLAAVSSVVQTVAPHFNQQAALGIAETAYQLYKAEGSPAVVPAA